MESEPKKYCNGPFLKKNTVLFRHYQNNIVHSCKNRNSLVVLPTGLGKTIIGILAIAHSLKKYPQAKIIILAPTRPLVSQHTDSCEKFLNIKSEEIVSLTGKQSPEKRFLLFRKSKVIVSTPQVIKNDIIRGRYDLTEVALIIFDEAHKTKGNYSYNFISKEYINTCNDPLILGLTASPGKDFERIQEICQNLHVENILYRSYEDDDVKEYIHDIDTFINFVSLPTRILELSHVWQDLFTKFLKFFIDRELINPYKKYYSKLEFLKITHDLTITLRFEQGYELEEDIEEYLYYQDPKLIDIIKKNDIDVHSVYSYCSSCISLLHAKDLLETQEISLFLSFLEKIKFKAEQGVLSAKRIANSKHFKLVNSIIEKENLSITLHPKISKLISIIQEEFEEFDNKKIIVFTQYREMAEFLKRNLQYEFRNQYCVEKFIGQSSKVDDMGYSQKVQTEVLRKFRDNKINVLIATSVAEEGIDIPNVNAIIFYEPVPSEIRLIQRRGRTGRYAAGRCYILITEDTIDIPFQIVAKRKERLMKAVLADYEQIELEGRIDRKKIKFSKQEYDQTSDFGLIRNFQKRRDQEKELLMNHSIEQILFQLDEFSKSEAFRDLKKSGVTFYSDLINWELPEMKQKILKIKGKKMNNQNKRKRYLNRNVKSLINIVKFYGEKGTLDFKEFQSLAEEEEIIDRKFYIHFNQACNLGYLKKTEDLVHFINDYE